MIRSRTLRMQMMDVMARSPHDASGLAVGGIDRPFDSIASATSSAIRVIPPPAQGIPGARVAGEHRVQKSPNHLCERVQVLPG
jgi:hypothetical protein